MNERSQRISNVTQRQETRTKETHKNTHCQPRRWLGSLQVTSWVQTGVVGEGAQKTSSLLPCHRSTNNDGGAGPIKMVICDGFQYRNRPELSALLQQAILLLQEKAGPQAPMPQGDWCMNGKQSLPGGTLPSLPFSSDRKLRGN